MDVSLPGEGVSAVSLYWQALVIASSACPKPASE
jgi:hypothetical protein